MMLRQWTILAAVTAVFASASAQELPAVDHAVVARSAATCNAEGAFGQTFGSNGPAMLHPGPKIGSEWAPFRGIDLNNTMRSHALFLVEATAYYGGPDEPLSKEREHELASRFYNALVAEIDATRQFAKREKKDDGIAYSSAADGKSGYSLEVSLMGGSVYLTCTDVAGQKLALQEAFGDGPASRPEMPALSLPPRPSADTCADPAKFDVAKLNDLMADMGRYSAASSSYFQQLADWKGQQLVDKKVWTKKQKTAFSLAVFKDPVIAKGYSQNMTRFATFLHDVTAVVDAQGTNKHAAQCAAVVRVLNTVHDMQDSNEVQWKRVIELYDAEARRLKVTIE